jgi:hypothetical protein
MATTSRRQGRPGPASRTAAAERHGQRSAAPVGSAELDEPPVDAEERVSAARRGLRAMLRKLTATEEELDAEELRAEASAAGCTPCGEARRGDLVSVTGRLRTVVYTPRTNLPTLEADLYDGSDVVTLVFLGRRHIAGIEPGRPLTVRGRVAIRDGRKVIYNPYYELDPHAQ